MFLLPVWFCLVFSSKAPEVIKRPLGFLYIICSVLFSGLTVSLVTTACTHPGEDKRVQPNRKCHICGMCWLKSVRNVCQQLYGFTATDLKQNRNSIEFSFLLFWLLIFTKTDILSPLVLSFHAEPTVWMHFLEPFINLQSFCFKVNFSSCHCWMGFKPISVIFKRTFPCKAIIVISDEKSQYSDILLFSLKFFWIGFHLQKHLPPS